MKIKIIYILIFLSIFITSCSASDNNTRIMELEKENIELRIKIQELKDRMEIEKQIEFHRGMKILCDRIPSQPNVFQSPPMFFPSECDDMVEQARIADLYHNSFPTPTPEISKPQG